MKKITLTLLIAITAGLLSAFAPAAQFDYANPESAQAVLLSADETAGLVFMREEEKLAHDLYAAFFDLYGLQTFENIAASELTHANAVISLLDLNGIADPAAGKAAGVFNDEALQDMYDQLLAQGSQSLAEALKVAAAVEEIDILDLQKRSAQTSNPDIIGVYENLEAGSNNHLRAYVSQLKNRAGETYSPGYLPVDEFNAILADAIGKPDRGFGGGNGQRGARNR